MPQIHRFNKLNLEKSVNLWHFIKKKVAKYASIQS